MPPIKIDKRPTDAYVIYNKNLKRLDFWSGEVYQDEGFWRVILWANPEYDYETDIPDNTVIRIPRPIIDISQEIVQKIVEQRDTY